MIGIIIRGRNYEEGGGYTLTHDLLDELLKSKYNDFFFIIINDINGLLEKKIKKKNFLYKKIYINKNLLYFTNFIKSFLNYGLVNKLLPLDLDKILKANNINFVWFLSSEFYYPMKTKYILTVWDLMHITHENFPETGSFFINLYRKKVINKSIKNAYKIIVGSSYIKKVIKSHIIKKKDSDFILAKHPTPKKFLNTRINHKKKKLSDYFFYPANFWEHKNHQKLLLSFKKFNIGKRFQLILTGNTNTRYFLKIINFIKKNNISNIRILGFVSQKKIINLYDQSLGLIYPSFSGPENIPPLEAMARGKPVAISNYSGAKEQLGNNVFYFNPNLTNSIIKGFEYLLQFSKKNNFKKKIKNFSKKNTSENYFKIILKNLT